MVAFASGAANRGDWRRDLRRYILLDSRWNHTFQPQRAGAGHLVSVMAHCRTRWIVVVHSAHRSDRHGFRLSGQPRQHLHAGIHPSGGRNRSGRFLVAATANVLLPLCSVLVVAHLRFQATRARSSMVDRAADVAVEQRAWRLSVRLRLDCGNSVRRTVERLGWNGRQRHTHSQVYENCYSWRYCRFPFL